jgi:hypothetical protein
MMGGTVMERKVFVIACKRCQRHVPAGVTAFPEKSVAVSLTQR